MQIPFGAINVTSARHYGKTTEMNVRLTNEDKKLAPVFAFSDGDITLNIDHVSHRLSGSGYINLQGNFIHQITVPLKTPHILPLLAKILKNRTVEAQTNLASVGERKLRDSQEYLTALDKTYPDVKFENTNGSGYYSQFNGVIQIFERFMTAFPPTS